MRIAWPHAWIAFTVAAPVGVSAQTHALDRGSILVGGQASLNSSQSEANGEESPRLTSLSLAPRALFFVSPGLALGGQVLLARVSANDNSATSWGVGPEAAYYFGAAGRTAHPYLTASAQWLRTSDGDGDAQNGRTFGGGVGLLFLISSSVGIDAQAYIRRAHTNFNNGLGTDFDQTAYGLAFGISAFVF